MDDIKGETFVKDFNMATDEACIPPLEQIRDLEHI